MARLTQLRVCSNDVVTEHGIVPPRLHFRGTTHHVTEMFANLLGRQYTLNGSSLVQITCGPRGNEPEFYNVLGTTEVFVESFDFGAYHAMGDAGREQAILALVEDHLLAIAEKEQADPEPIRSCAAAVRHHGFELEQEA